MALGKNPLAAGVQQVSEEPLSVSEAVGSAKAQVKAMPTLRVAGEVTGFRGPNARSGHCYFGVKDDSSSMDVIIWRNTYSRLGLTLRDGMSLVLTGSFDVYVGTGRLSFIVRSVELAGEGLLRQQVAQLARKLEAEGLMAPERKRRIPRFCVRVAVVTSLSGSVIDDVKRTLRRRNPLVELDVVGCAVQGPEAPATIVRALQVAAAARPEAILLVRGGGSFEDLMTFNDETLARAVASCPVPVVTGIGHEPDTSICDMVSDRRCSTPTAAAESVAPAIDEIVNAIENRRIRMGNALRSMAQAEGKHVDGLDVRAQQAVLGRITRERSLLEAMSSRRCLSDPMTLVEDRTVQLMQSEQRLHDALPRLFDRCSRDVELQGSRLVESMPRLMGRTSRDIITQASRLNTCAEGLLRPYEATIGRAAASLEALSPLAVLSRGYAIALDGEGHVVGDAAQVEVGQEVNVRLGHGSFGASVTKIALD